MFFSFKSWYQLIYKMTSRLNIQKTAQNMVTVTGRFNAVFATQMFIYNRYFWKALHELLTTCSGPIKTGKKQKCVTTIVLFLKPNEC